MRSSRSIDTEERESGYRFERTNPDRPRLGGGRGVNSRVEFSERDDADDLIERKQRDVDWTIALNGDQYARIEQAALYDH